MFLGNFAGCSWKYFFLVVGASGALKLRIYVEATNTVSIVSNIDEVLLQEKLSRCLVTEQLVASSMADDASHNCQLSVSLYLSSSPMWRHWECTQFGCSGIEKY